MLTRSDVHNFLLENGIKSSDTVLIHTSMRALGAVEGGCDGLIDHFTSFLHDGLFIIPTHTWANVNRESPIYNVYESVPCIGALPRVAAKRRDGVRSLHPTHSVMAFGRRAAEFTAGEESSETPCPRGGVWQRLYDEDAKILLLGVGLNRSTYIHAIDEMINLEGRLMPPIPLTVIGYRAERYNVSFMSHNSDMTGSENFGNFEKPLTHLGALRHSKLGNADVLIFNTRRATEIIKALWKAADYHLCLDKREIPKEYYIGGIASDQQQKSERY